MNLRNQILGRKKDTKGGEEEYVDDYLIESLTASRDMLDKRMGILEETQTLILDEIKSLRKEPELRLDPTPSPTRPAQSDEEMVLDDFASLLIDPELCGPEKPSAMPIIVEGKRSEPETPNEDFFFERAWVILGAVESSSRYELGMTMSQLQSLDMITLLRTISEALEKGDLKIARTGVHFFGVLLDNFVATFKGGDMARKVKKETAVDETGELNRQLKEASMEIEKLHNFSSYNNYGLKDDILKEGVADAKRLLEESERWAKASVPARIEIAVKSLVYRYHLSTEQREYLAARLHELLVPFITEWKNRRALIVKHRGKRKKKPEIKPNPKADISPETASEPQEEISEEKVLEEEPDDTHNEAVSPKSDSGD